MNAQYRGHWDVAPKGHPNDGRLDLLDADPTLGQRWQARSRLRTGTHVPHPAIEERRITAVQLDLGRPTPIELDGEPLGTATTLSIRVEPDALVCIV
jgi:diacylglycerol kinase family enzyme